VTAPLLAGRRALVTGAAGGIGLASARRFAAEGARVALSDLAGAGLAEAAGGIDGAVAVPFDVTDEAAVTRGFEEAQVRLGELDLLVANAGILRLRALVDEELDAFRRVLEVNLIGVFLCVREAARRFAEGGVILVTSSQAGRHGYAQLGAYCASKFAVVGLTETLAKELAPRGIRVNAVAPGLIRTAMHDALVAGRGRELAAEVPFRRVGEPEEVAQVLAFLASSGASYVSGATVVVDGGEGS
jgi:NAD(P)-dependent dehydrogenase (short-subunit alcohol dehydrogenase family)